MILQALEILPRGVCCFRSQPSQTPARSMRKIEKHDGRSSIAMEFLRAGPKECHHGTCAPDREHSDCIEIADALPLPTGGYVHGKPQLIVVLPRWYYALAPGSHLTTCFSTNSFPAQRLTVSNSTSATTRLHRADPGSTALAIENIVMLSFPILECSGEGRLHGPQDAVSEGLDPKRSRMVRRWTTFCLSSIRGGFGHRYFDAAYSKDEPLIRPTSPSTLPGPSWLLGSRRVGQTPSIARRYDFAIVLFFFPPPTDLASRDASLSSRRSAHRGLAAAAVAGRPKQSVDA